MCFLSFLTYYQWASFLYTKGESDFCFGEQRGRPHHCQLLTPFLSFFWLNWAQRGLFAEHQTLLKQRDHHAFTPPDTWLCYKGAAMKPDPEHGRFSNKCLLMWVSLLCLDWARILLTDPLGFKITLIQWFSTRVPNPAPCQSHRALPRDIWSPQGPREQVVYATGIWWEEIKEAANHPTQHRTALTAKNYPAQNSNSTQVWKPCSPFAFLPACSIPSKFS